MNDEEDHYLPPELKELLRIGNPVPAPIPPLSDGVSFPFPFNREHGKDEGTLPSTGMVDTINGFEQLLPKNKEPEEVQGSIDVALSVKCNDTSMTVAVAKDSLEVGAISYFLGRVI